MVEEKGIGAYLRPLARHTLIMSLIVVAVVVASLLVAGLSAPGQPYQAEAVIVARVTGTEHIVLNNSGGIQDTNFDLTQQAQNVTQLIAAADVAADVKKAAESSNDAAVKALAAQDPATLLNAMDVTARGNLVSVKARLGDAGAATWLANEWATAGVAKVNRIYTAPPPDIEQALNTTQADLAASQKAVEDYLASSPIVTLAQEITQTRQFIETAIGANIAEHYTLYGANRQAINDRLRLAYSSVFTLDQQLSDLGALRTRIAGAPDDPDTLYTNQVTLLLAVNRALNSNPGTSQIQLNVSDLGKTGLTKAGQLASLDSTIAAVQTLQDDLRRQITDLESQLRTAGPAAGPDNTNQIPAGVQESIARLNQLQSEMDRRQFDLDQLQRTRAMQQNAYDLLRTRLAEQRVNQIIGEVVEVGSTANEAATLRSRSLWRTLMTGGVIGVLLAGGLALGVAILLNLLWPAFNSNLAVLRRLTPRRVGRVA